MNKTKTKIILLGLISSIMLPCISFAQNVYNLGDLDFRLSSGKDQIAINALPGDQYNTELRLANFSDQKLTIKLYASEADYKQNSFIPLPAKDGISDSSKWINLASKEIELSPKETKLLSVNINVPEQAGVGVHYSAIMAKYQHLDNNQNLINIEKGIRVITNIEGKAINKYQIINPQVTHSERFSTYSATVYNSGNANLRGTINLTNQNSETSYNKQNTEIFLTPGATKKIDLSVEKPIFGSDTLSAQFNLANTTKTFILNEGFYIPNALILMAAIGLIGLIIGFSSKKHLRRILAFISITAITAIVVLIIPFLNEKLLKADVLNTVPQTGYLTTIKWGNFDSKKNSNETILWNGAFKASSGKMAIVEKLHNENRDHLYLNSLQNTLNFDNVTGKDNDGVILFIKPDNNDPAPHLIYSNDFSKEEIFIDLKSNIDQVQYIDFKNSQIEIKTEIAGTSINLKTGDQEINLDTINFGQNIELPIIEIESTADNAESIVDEESTSDSNEQIYPTAETRGVSQQLQEEISLLREIIEDIPASPEVLSEYILNSNYVEEVISENNSTRVTADPLLIEKLKDTPITIQEIAATPELNFIFIPNEPIELVPQQFSFDQSRTTSQEIGEIVFVQNKLSSWNTYFSISDFVSVAGRGQIPASNVSIAPGNIKLINQNGEEAFIESGSARRLSGSDDQATLVTVTPQGEGETIFSMKPQLSVEIPANTPPGLYRAEISIKVL